MTPEQQAIIKALLAGGMPQGDMQGVSPLRQRAMMADAQRAQQGRADAFYDAAPRPSYAGARLQGMTGEPFDPREALSAPMMDPRQIATRDNMMEGAGMDPVARSQIGPDMPVMNPGKWMFDDPLYESMWRDMGPVEQQRVMRLLSANVPIAEAFDSVLGVDMNAITRGR